MVVCVPKILEVLRDYVIRVAPEAAVPPPSGMHWAKRWWHYRRLHRMFQSIGLDVIRHPPRESLQWQLMRLFQQLDINCVLDVGANHGQYACLLREWGYRGDIVSFEPVPEVFESLQRTMAGDARWRGHPWALGEANDELEIHVARGDARASSFLTFNADGPARWGDVCRSWRASAQGPDTPGAGLPTRGDGHHARLPTTHLA